MNRRLRSTKLGPLFGVRQALIMHRRTVSALAVLLLLGGMHLTGAGGWTATAKDIEVGDESRPLPEVTVELYGGNDSYPAPGVWLRSTTTNAEGWYGLDVYDDDVFEFYHIREINPPGFGSVGATSVDGTRRTDDWIEYEAPLEGQIVTGNKCTRPHWRGRLSRGTSSGTEVLRKRHPPRPQPSRHHVGCFRAGCTPGLLGTRATR